MKFTKEISGNDCDSQGPVCRHGIGDSYGAGWTGLHVDGGDEIVVDNQ